MFSPDQWAASTGVAFYNGVATQSLRLDDGSSPYLSKSFGTSNRKTGTYSIWIKRSNLSLGNGANILSGGDATTNDYFWGFTNTDTLQIRNITSNSYNLEVFTQRVFRDTSAWYNIVVVQDTTQSTTNDRLKIYINGIQDTNLTYTTMPSQNADTSLNLSGTHYISKLSYANQAYIDGYIAEVNFIDGTAYDASYFGEFKNGVWIPKEPSVTYGTNGFRLQFNQTGTGTASSSTIGADTSGNDNHFSSSGIVASDCSLLDSPENNFCTLSSIQNQTSATLSDGNLKAVGTSANWDNLQSTFAVTSGKWYWEVKATSVSEANSFVAGIHETGFPAQSLFWFSGSYTTSAYGTAFGVLDPDNKVTNGSATAFTLGLATNDIIQFRLNLDDNELSVSIDGSDKGKIYDITANIEYTPALCLYNTSSATMNFGQDSTFAGATTAGGNTDANGIGDFKYSVPSGYLALCTANLPEPTISPNADTQADDYFNTVLYTGDGTSSLPITGVGFQPDWLWIKRRNGANPHAIFDAIRGTELRLSSDKADAELNPATDDINSFDTDGFTLNANGTVNTSSGTYVSWNWKAGGTAVSNTDGSITSSVSANTDAGFSIVSYTGNKTRGATIGHGLGVKPDMIIMKNRDLAVSWVVWFPNLQANNQLLELNSTGAVLTNTGDPNAWWNNTSPTSSVITLGDYDGINDDLSMIAYCFAEVEGYSKFGSYTGNGSTDGTFVYTGFRPQYMMFKRTDTTGNWFVKDNKREPFNVMNINMHPNLNNAEGSPSGTHLVDGLSNGFKFKGAGPELNASGGTYIYMAFAEVPFKYSLSR